MVDVILAASTSLAAPVEPSYLTSDVPGAKGAAEQEELLGLGCLLRRRGIKVHDSMAVLLPRAVSEADDLLPLQQSGRTGQKRVS